MAVGDGGSCTLARLVAGVDSQLSDNARFVYTEIAAPMETIMAGAASLALTVQLAREMLVDGQIDWTSHIWRYGLFVVAGALLSDPGAFMDEVFDPVKSFIFGLAGKATGVASGETSIGGMVCSTQEVVDRSARIAERMYDNSYIMGAVGAVVMGAWVVVLAMYLLTVFIGDFMLYIPVMLGPVLIAAVPFQATRRFTMSAVDLWIGSAGFFFFAGIAIGMVSASIADVFANTPAGDETIRQAAVDQWIQDGSWISFAVAPVLAFAILLTTGRWVAYFSNRMEASVGGSARSTVGAIRKMLRLG